jgi:hypothetical protein
MDVKQLFEERRRLNIRLFQEFRDFEIKTGMEITGMRINRDEQGIQSVAVKVEMPD